MVGKLNAIKTKKFGQLVKLATRLRQELRKWLSFIYLSLKQTKRTFMKFPP